MYMYSYKCVPSVPSLSRSLPILAADDTQSWN